MKSLKPEHFTWDVPLADELPLEPFPKDMPHPSENYWYTATDSDSGLAFFVQVGRWVKNPAIWRAYFSLFLPDGTLLLSQTMGRGDCSAGPNTGVFSTACENPGKLVAVRFSGPAQHVPLDQLTEPAALPAVLDNLELDLKFEGTAPYWYFPESDTTTWSNFHTEQLGRVTGTVRHNDRTCRFNGAASRDHSRGPREVSTWRGHTWINGHFDDIAFSIYEVWSEVAGREERALGEAKIIKDGEYIEAKVAKTPRLTSFDGILKEYDLVLESRLGRMEVRGIPKAMAFLSVQPGFSHFRPGIAAGLKEYPNTVIEQPSRFEYEGRTGYGWTERSFYKRGVEAQILDAEQFGRIYAARR